MLCQCNHIIVSENFNANSMAELQCAQNPVPIGVGYLAQYIVKPLLGYGIAKVCLHSKTAKLEHKQCTHQRWLL